jgi:hypothetical protein
MSRRWVHLVGILAALAAGQTRAAPLEGAGAGVGSAVQVHGFVSQGAIKSTGNNYLAESKRGSVELTEGAINFTSALSDRLRVGFQLFVRDLGPVGNYTPKMDWLYFDYRWFDWMGLRAGRVKIPFGLYNEINDVDSARVPVLLPQSVYPIGNRDFLLAQTGLELYGRAPMGEAGSLEYRLYGGTIFVEGGGSAGPVTISPYRVPYVAGGRLMWETPIDGLRLGGSAQTVRIDFDVNVATLATKVQFPVRLWLGSLEYAADALTLAAEYGRWHGKFKSTNPLLFPEVEATNERFYAMGALRVTSWLQPGVYYSVLYPNVDDRKGRDSWQHDLAGTLRFDINQHWLLKLEGHYMKGTAGLDDSVDKQLNDNKPLKELARQWLVLLLKTTVYF